MMIDSQQRESEDDRIALCVVHGHLAFASFPVLAGHYSGDAFAGTEARLDRALGFRLSERRKLGLYPGRVGTSVIVLDPICRPSGAIIVGLGHPASLSIGALRETLRQGILAFVAERMDRGSASSAETGPGTRRLGLSSLLVGSGEGGIDRTSCVQALLQAACQANAMLAGLQNAHARLDAIEIVELFEDRAYETWRAANKAIEADPVLKAGLGSPPLFRQREGGRRHAPIAQDPNWWQPIQITMPRVEGPEDRSLSFTVGGGFARAEARTLAANLDIVAPLLRRTTQNIDLDGAPISPGRILFELLWPESLKHRSFEEQRRRLILDEESAAFPWELLDDRRPWISAGNASEDSGNVPDRKPPAVRAGLVRQLLQTRFSERIVTARGKPKALVIGDPGAQPIEGFPELPGAEAEAIAVAEMLGAKRQSHDVTLLVKAAATPDQIFKQLLGQAWEIVHVSAHGVVNCELPRADGTKRRVTGVVLGRGVVLGPSELSKLPVSPSIFFVNCCNLGKIDASAEDEARRESVEGRPELAASVAVELIKLGVRCVIVAGWEVNDDCAKAFGLRFYSEMLDGASFGEATLQARRAAYETNQNDNTWGAYQCYGDPDYRLRARTDNPAAADETDRFVGVSEAIEAAEQIRDAVNIGLERDLDVQRRQLAKIESEAKRKDWLHSAPLCAALAEARAELGDLAEAIDYYSSAVRNENAGFKLRAVEQLANLRSRNAVREFRTKPKDARDPADAIATIQASLHTLEMLTEAVGSTPERLSLRGGCWKRLAQVQPLGSAAEDALREMKQCCESAAKLGGKDPDYPLLMACNASICTAVRDGAAIDPIVGEELQRIIDQAPPDEADFWKLIRSADARTNVAIMQAPSPNDTDKIKDAYRRAWRHIGSPVKMRSVTEQLEFYEDIFAGGAQRSAATRARIVEWTADLRRFIESEFLAK